MKKFFVIFSFILLTAGFFIRFKIASENKTENQNNTALLDHKPEDIDYFLNLHPSEYELSILTAGRGKEIYMLGGHLLLRIKEKRPDGKDISVNWGIFDFSDPNFYLNYAIGKLNYKVMPRATSYEKYHFVNQPEGRRTYENTLNLTATQKITILNRVNWWLEPEHSTYRYHFFDTNCSTIIRDLLSEALGPNFDEQLKGHPYMTFRQMGRRYFSNYPVFAFLAPLIFNSRADMPMSFWERFRVPVEAPDILDEVKQVDDQGRKLSTYLIGDKTIFVEGIDLDFATFEYSLFVLCGFLLLVLLSFVFKKRKKSFLRLRALGGSLVFLGVFNFFWSTLMIILWTFTEHDYTHHNAHLLILYPFDILFSLLGLYLLFFNRYPKKESFLTTGSLLLIKAHAFTASLQLVLFLFDWIKQDVSFIYIYLIPPYILFSLILLKDLSSKNSYHLR